jgi:hypothetical protein
MTIIDGVYSIEPQSNTWKGLVAVYKKNGVWTPAIANGTDTLSTHIAYPENESSLYLIQEGRIRLEHDYIPGQFYFLSDTQPGQAMVNQPNFKPRRTYNGIVTYRVSKPLFKAQDKLIIDIFSQPGVYTQQ